MSETSATGTLARTPLFDEHRALGAKIVEFGGWEMPVSYRGIIDEHNAVRTAAGLFDVSHMGEIEVLGPHAAATCQRLTTNDVRKLANGHVQYTLLCREDGGVVDDVTLYRVNEQRYFFCVNASNIAKDLAWIEEHAGDATIVDRSEATALVALQGPAARGILQPLTPLPLDRLKSFRFARTEVAGLPAFVSRTGYTGEDGFEIFVDTPRATTLWTALMAAGRDVGLEPIGLGARDTLRLEAALPLYGHELDDSTSPLAAGLGRWVKLDDSTSPLAAGLGRWVKLDGEDFVGRAALLHEQERGAPRRLVGLALRGPGIARQGYPVSYEGAQVGVVTSGTHSPTLGSAVALAYVAAALAAPGTALAVDIRGRAVPVEVIPTPFYRRPRPAPAPVAEAIAEDAAPVTSDATDPGEAPTTQATSHTDTPTETTAADEADLPAGDGPIDLVDEVSAEDTPASADLEPRTTPAPEEGES